MSQEGGQQMRSLRRSDSNGNSKPAPSTKRRPFPGEAALHRMVEEARYELDVDPYRGMIRTTDSPMSPWEASCRWGAPSSSSENDDASTSSPAAAVVQMTCQNQCPCMIQWTEQRQKRKGKKAKKKGLGTRPTAGDRCRCDYNPWCLTSLGGAMNQVWERRLVKLAGGAADSSKEVIDLIDSGSEASVAVSDTPELSANPSSDLDKTVYQQRTWADLRSLRESQWVDRAKVADYLKNTLHKLTDAFPVDMCLERIEAWHRQLLFSNPLREMRSQEGQVQITIPPGIENLGATCYLNTQLQCLAQISVFLKGIFSWQAPENNDDKVHEVLRLFQKIMADLHMGTKRTTTTVEFSNALGIDHFEQQDPNEFSRLFFDLMHNAFQKEASVGKPDGLSDLLPGLFEGTIENSIKCQKCSRRSARKEAFMDINLPISLEEGAGPRKKGQSSILEWLPGNKRELDVQLLFDRYCQDESLEGDNQYYCETCKSKQDATRRTKFTKVPPVLNIQLSRYIFDLKTLAKKKVTDKVLLPRQMTVQAETENPSNPADHTYLLCAVMIHKGKSAYSGHYVAQAMDWTTGCWFDFNDTQVKLLKDGPDCSFDPKKDNGKIPKGVSGSQDAYNLYYVEENFLAQSVLELVQDLDPSRVLSTTILQEKAEERMEWYKELEDACIKDREAAFRLKKRRRNILNDLFSPDHPLETIVDREDPPPVWVPFSFLRRFLSCTDTFEDELANDIVRDVIKASESLCEHNQKGLHPREARRGKLLPRILYETIVDSLREEQKCFLVKEQARIDANEDGFVITPADGMFCQECVDDYRAGLRSKLVLLEDYLFLFKELILNVSDEPLEFDPGTIFQAEKEKFVYLVSKKFCTAFRDHVKQIMKKVSDSDAESFSVDEKLLPLFESTVEGVETLKTGDIAVNDASSVDMFVNENLTCPHGRRKRYNKNQVRFVSWKVWHRIQKLFPHATELREEKRSSDQAEIIDVADEECPLCESNSTLADSMASDLSEIARTLSLMTIYKQADVDDILLADLKETFHAVHVADGNAVRRFCRKFKNSSSKTGVEQLIRDVLHCFQADRVLAPCVLEDVHSDSTELDDSDRRVLQMVEKLIRPLKCRSHCLPVGDVVAKSSTAPGDNVLSSQVRFLASADFRAYMSSLTVLALVLIMAKDKDYTAISDQNGIETFMIDAVSEKLFSAFSKWHPTARYVASSLFGSRSVTIPREDVSTRLVWDTELCDCKKCLAEMNESLATKPSKDTENKSEKASGNAADNPILIDVDTDGGGASPDTFPLNVLEAEGEASESRILDELALYTGNNCVGVLENGGSSLGLRRSSRRRKTRVPMGPFTSEESIQADVCHNSAALRLSLFQSLKEGSEFSLDHRLFLGVFPVDTKAEPSDQKSQVPENKIVKLDFSKNQTTILEMAETALGGDLSTLVPKDSLVLVRQAVVEESAAGFGKDSIMDTLISLSNAAAKDPEDKKRRARTVERGFTGTLLSSSSPRQNIRNDDKTEKLDKIADGENCRALVAVNANSAVDTEAVPSPKSNSPEKVEFASCKRRKLVHQPEDEVLMDEDTEDDKNNTSRNVDPKQEETSRLIGIIQEELRSNIKEKQNPSLIFRAAERAVKGSRAHPALNELVEKAMMMYFESYYNEN